MPRTHHACKKLENKVWKEQHKFNKGNCAIAITSNIALLMSALNLVLLPPGIILTVLAICLVSPTHAIHLRSVRCPGRPQYIVVADIHNQTHNQPSETNA